jgi:pimeloyl-ACP methyl ester carboxylesterase
MSAVYKSEEGQRLVESRYRDLLARWPVPSEQRSISTSFGDTFVVACGTPSMSPVVLLQGSGANAAMWLRDVATLSASHRVYCVDVIGEPGLSAPSRPRLDASTYASWLREVLDHLSLAHVAMMGVSLRGWLALAFATAEPERVDRLVLVSTCGIGRARVSFVIKTLALMLMGSWGRRKALMLTVGPMRGKPDATALEMGRFAALISTHFKHRRERVPIFTDEALRRLTMPVLAIIGAQDALLDSDGTRRRLEAQVTQATVRMLPDAGHVVRCEIDDINAFLSGDCEAARVGHEGDHRGVGRPTRLVSQSQD